MRVGIGDAFFTLCGKPFFKVRGAMKSGIAIGVLCAFAVAPVRGEPLPFDRRTPVVTVVEKISPSVVMIKTDVKRKVMIDPFQSFGFDFRFRPGWVGEKTFTSAGSGVIVDQDGIVVTNAHVVADANRLTCITSDGMERSLTLIGVDNDFDIAVLQIDRDEQQPIDFPEIDWGTTTDLMMGETAIAIGSALSFQNSVSVGVISAMERTIVVPNRPEPYFGMIQTDAAINRGNSGGPLVNIRGELVGVTTLIATEGGGSDGIGFAIPVERVAGVYREFVKGVVSLEERLGIAVVNPHEVPDIHPSQMERLGLDRPNVRGLMVIKIEPDGLAARAGLREGDLLIEVGERKVPRRSDLQRALEEHDIDRGPAGKRLNVAALRVDPKNGQVSRINLELPTSGLPGHEKIERIDSWFGFDVVGIGNDVADRMGVSIDDGVVIRAVQNGSPAHLAGLAPGDLIQAVDSYRIQTVGDFRRMRHIAQNKEKVIFRIRRGNSEGVVELAQSAPAQGRFGGL